MVISILGCGWYGKALAKSLIEKGNIVKGSATSADKFGLLTESGIRPYLVQFNAADESFDAAFFDCEILIISIPPKLRKGETAAYLPKIDRIINAIKQFDIKRVIYISSTGVYSDSNSGVNEQTDPKPDTEAGRILLQAEQLFQNQPGFKTTIIRFAGLVGPGRDPGRFFAGKKDIPNGRAPINLIHLDDCMGISSAVIERDAFGYLLNAASRDHPPKQQFYIQATKHSGLELPVFIDELTDWKIVDSNVLEPLLGYQFKITSWSNCTFS
jgi:nucleoside-diphosphate-sugar epimerase